MLAILGCVVRSPSGFIYAVLLAVILRLRNPQVMDESEPMDRQRAYLALLTILVFVLSFLPFPIKLV